MRQKLVPRTVRRPSPTPAVMVRLRSTNTKKIQFTQRLPLGSELHMGKERCCLRGLDHLHGPTFHSICGNLMIYKPSLTNDRLMFEHDESLRADLLLINLPASYKNGKLEHFLHRWMKNREHNNFWLTMFPEKRYFRETTSTTEVAIHTNPFTDLYASIGTGSSRTGGCSFQSKNFSTLLSQSRKSSGCNRPWKSRTSTLIPRSSFYFEALLNKARIKRFLIKKNAYIHFLPPVLNRIMRKTLKGIGKGRRLRGEAAASSGAGRRVGRLALATIATPPPTLAEKHPPSTSPFPCAQKPARPVYEPPSDSLTQSHEKQAQQAQP
ncbi:hypothetical protein GBA52_015413 [Prunus armeniaca]|nr:hypothetical protein GBA52_015413 [Prunus armeniaca]